MVKIQLNLPLDIHRFISIKKEILGKKDKRETIIHILKETMENEKFLKKYARGV